MEKVSCCLADMILNREIYIYRSRKQEEKILNDPVAMYRFNDIVFVILNGLISGL